MIVHKRSSSAVDWTGSIHICTIVRVGERSARSDQAHEIHTERLSRRLRGMLAYMNRTTVKLPEDLDARLRHEAQRRGTTISEITREAIEAHLGGRAGRAGRRRLHAAGAGASGRTDISERIEEILAAEFGSSL